jgi:hypothetical protein
MGNSPNLIFLAFSSDVAEVIDIRVRPEMDNSSELVAAEVKPQDREYYVHYVDCKHYWLQRSLQQLQALATVYR